MTETRVDQGGVEALLAITPESRVDQAGIEALVSVGPVSRVDSSGIEALVAVTAVTGVPQAGVEVLCSTSPCGTKWAQIWTITRTDGEVFRFTSLDRDLEHGGQTYQACDSLVPSASEAVSRVDEAGSMDLSGALSRDGIDPQALYAGLFDGAEVQAWLVPWSGEGRPRLLLKGTFGSVEQGETGFKVELLGDGAKLQQTPLVRLLQPGCWKEFGDRFCTKDLGPLTVTGTVDSGSGLRAFTDAARVETPGYFRRGRVTFTTGDNAGISAEIKEHSSGGEFELWPRLPFVISAGDQYEMTPGCTNLTETVDGCNGCTDWANLLNYGGAKHVPGGDKRSSPKVTRSDD